MNLKAVGKKFNLASATIFRRSVVSGLEAGLKHFYGGQALRTLTTEQIARDQVALRAYPNLNQLRFEARPGEIIEIPNQTETALLARAQQALLGGTAFVEHSAGGDATRLGMGPKYLLTPVDIAKAFLRYCWTKADTFPLNINPNDLASISLGNRHMLQFTFDISRLAEKAGLNPGEVLRDQVTLSTLNIKSAEEIIRDFVRHDFFGLAPEKTLFMVDETYPGLTISEGKLVFAQNSEIGLYNHGHMVMQETMDKQLFHVRFNKTTGEIKRIYLSQEEVEQILSGMQNKQSVPIEDNDYLTQAVDLNALALAIQLSEQDYRMVMEIVGQKQKPDKPQPGGFLAFDPVLNRRVMIESDCGGTVIVEKDEDSLRKIAHLNRNVNLFPAPVDVWKTMATEGLPFLHPVVKEGFLYIQPPQGDQNFLVSTAFVRRQEVKQINNLKELGDVPNTLSAMLAQDQQENFLSFARRFGF